MTDQTRDHGPEYRHAGDLPGETLRFPGQHSKMVFHPRPERPTQPNTGFVRYEPGAYHPRRRHDFARVRYILEGTFKIGERTVGPGTGKGPIYDGRFNMAERKPLSEENLQV